MTENTFIEELSQKIANYNTPEQAISQANSCDLLSNDIYIDSKRFIYELLQNADDASCQSGKLEFQIDFVENYIVVSHKGEPFSEIDVKSICSVGDGNKEGEENKTGFKGIGFKSVFAHSEFVIIKSGQYCFKFDKQECNKWNPDWGDENDWKAERKADRKDDKIKIPWQIIPICTVVPSELNDLSVFKQSEYNVSTIIRYKKIEELKKSLIELFSESQIILFLRSKEIKITINTEDTLILEKSIVDETAHLKCNNEVISEWLIKTTQFDIPQGIQYKIKDNNRYPRKLRESKRTEISFAVQLEKGKLKATDNDKRLLFTYLPTSINYNLPFLINANFLTDAGRENIHKDLKWNQWLFKQIPLKYFSWIAELADRKSKYNEQIFDIIPRQLSDSNELENKFNNGYVRAIKTIAFIPNQNGDLLKVSEALLDDTNISAFIGKQILVNHINREKNKHFSASSFIPIFGKSILRELGVEIFRIDDLENFFVSDIFSREHQISENFKLISFLFDQANNSRKIDEENDWNYRLKNTAFIFDEDGKLQKPKHIYFPSVEFSEDFQDDIHIIHEDVLIEINKNRQIKSWLESLGVAEPTDVNFIEKTIIGDQNFVTVDNAIEVGRYLFNAYKKGLLENLFYDLRNTNILTKREILKKAQECFLPVFYEPELKLEQVIDIDFFVSEDYFEEKDLKSEWKSFFLKIGVADDIKPVYLTIGIEEVNANRFDYDFLEKVCAATDKFFWTSGDWTTGKGDYDFALSSISCETIPFLQYATKYNFSKLYFERVFAKYMPSNLDREISVFGYTGIIPRNNLSTNLLRSQGCPTYYFRWVIENIELIPTVQQKCLKSTDVFANSIPQIREIAGKYLPILDYDGIISPEWMDLLKLKEQLKLEDYLEVLTKISQEIDEEEQKENRKRISLIYEKLSEILPNLHPSQKEPLRRWGEENRLLAKDGDFYLPKELSLVTIDGFNANNLIYTEKKDTGGFVELFRLWGISIIDKVTPKFSNSTITQESLKRQLYLIAPLLALVAVEKSKSKKEWEDEYKRINQRLSEISFFETTEIQLSYGDGSDLQRRSSYADRNSFYYVGNWYKPRILDGLVEPLCKFLKIGYAERILTVLLSDFFSEGLKYLEEKGFNCSLIPEHLTNPKEEKRVPNQDNREHNQSDEDIGKKGELIVFEDLKRIFSNKYGQSIEEIENGFIIIGSNLKVIWRNKSENTTADHDFKIIENNKEFYIDSKATTYGKNVEKVALYISGDELNLMEKAEKYLIARVYNVFGNSSVEYVRLQIDDIAI